MKTHTTNYHNTLIEIAEDANTQKGEMPPVKADKKTVAHLQFMRLYENPYKYDSDEVLFDVYAERKAFEESEMAEQRVEYFSTGQPCFHTSPLTKRYGWGVHSNADGKIAIHGLESDEYKRLVNDPSVKKVKAMRSKRK